jgi:hypothetical protein
LPDLVRDGQTASTIRKRLPAVSMSAVANAHRATSAPAEAPSVGGTSAIAVRRSQRGHLDPAALPGVGEVGALLEPELADEEL